MRLQRRITRVFITAVMAIILVFPGIVPGTKASVSAAEEIKTPDITETTKTLYVGYENYKIRFQNLNKTATVTYQSDSPKVATVSGKGVVKALSRGTAGIKVTIKQNNKTYASKLTVTVESPYIVISDLKFTLEKGESYLFQGTAYGIKGAAFTWTSSDPKVASVNKKTGEVKGLSVGTTTITVTDSVIGTLGNATISVVEPYVYTPPKGSDKAVYLSGLDLSQRSGAYYTTTKEEYIETSRFVLYLDEGIEVPVNIIDLVNHVMDQIEDTSGYQFYVEHKPDDFYDLGMNYELDHYFSTAQELKKVNPEHERVEIVVANHDQAVDAYASGASGILLAPEHIHLMDYNDYVIVHELFHIAWQRNGGYLGSVLAEGFAEYYTTEVLNKDDVLKSTYSSYENLKNYENIINENTIEDLFLNYQAGSSRYQFGFRLTCFLIETYGKDGYGRMHEKATEDYSGSGDIPMDIVMAAMKSELSEDVFLKFAKWHSENLERFGDKDMSSIGDWSISNGTLYKYYGDDKNVVIPDGVTLINGEAFMDNTSIETVQIPDTVTDIGAGAFFDCKNLKEIIIPDSVTGIYFNAFEGCSGLKKVVLPKGLKKLTIRIFMNCTALTEITLPEGMTTIEENAFSGCSALKQINLPGSLTEIKASSFTGCKSLEKIVIPEGVKRIPEYTFMDCSNLKSITLPKDMTKIEDGTFWGTGFKTIELPIGLTSIGNAAFDFGGLESIVIPDTVTAIGDFAFANNKKLKSITIPKSVKSIGKETFYGCPGYTIYGAKGSYAETYAKNNGIKFSVIK